MKRTLSTLAVLGVSAVLAGCGEQAAEEAAPAPAAPATATAPATGGDMPGMAAAPGLKMGSGTGEVTAINSAAGTVTLDHTAMPQIGWPAMTMAFKAAPEVLQDVEVGDKVTFDVRVENGTSEVTAIRKAG